MLLRRVGERRIVSPKSPLHSAPLRHLSLREGDESGEE